MARSLEISCLETSVEVEALILWCWRGMGGNIWAQGATSGHPLPFHSAPSILHPPRARSIHSPKDPRVLGVSCGTQSTPQSPAQGATAPRWDLRYEFCRGVRPQPAAPLGTTVLPSTPGS